MTTGGIIGRALAGLIVILALAAGIRALYPESNPAPAESPSMEFTITHPNPETTHGFLYGRITTITGTVYEGRLRFGRGEEAFWSDYFNGWKDVNPWLAHLPPERMKVKRPVEIFGVKIAQREREIEAGRPFMMRFGDIAAIEARGGDVRVTLKSGAVFDLDRFAASDFDDGVRVWDVDRGVVDLDSLRIRKIEFLPTPSLKAAPYRLHGTVDTQQGAFTGFIQWNREECVGSDEFDGLRFGAIRSIQRSSSGRYLVTLLDDRQVPRAGRLNRGIYVDDPRFGRVLVSRDAFRRVDFSPGGSGPAYDDYPAGSLLAGTVTTREGDRLTGRLVFDLDESATTETLDAPFQGVDYTIPFGLIESITPSGVFLRNGEALQLEPAGDLGENNAGLLIFIGDHPGPEYVPWSDVEKVEFRRRY